MCQGCSPFGPMNAAVPRSYLFFFFGQLNHDGRKKRCIFIEYKKKKHVLAPFHAKIKQDVLYSSHLSHPSCRQVLADETFARFLILVPLLKKKKDCGVPIAVILNSLAC